MNQKRIIPVSLLVFVLLSITFASQNIPSANATALNSNLNPSSGTDYTSGSAHSFTSSELTALFSSDDSRYQSSTWSIPYASSWNSGSGDRMIFAFSFAIPSTATITSVQLINEYQTSNIADFGARIGVSTDGGLTYNAGATLTPLPTVTGTDVTDTIDITSLVNTPAKANALRIGFEALGTNSPLTSHDMLQVRIQYVITPSVSLTPASGFPGSTVAITGTYFNPSSTITITFNDLPTSTNPSAVTSNPSGAFSASIIVPSWVSIGSSYSIKATDGTNTQSATCIIPALSSFGMDTISGHHDADRGGSSSISQNLIVSTANPNDLIYVCVYTVNTGTTLSIQSSTIPSSSWNPRGSVNLGNNHGHMQSWYVISPTVVSGESITLTSSATSLGITAMAFVISGVNPNSPFDDITTTAPATASTAYSSSVTKTTNAANEITVGLLGLVAQASPPTAGTSYTRLDSLSSSNPAAGADEYRLNSPQGSNSIGFSWGTSSYWIEMAEAFVPASVNTITINSPSGSNSLSIDGYTPNTPQSFTWFKGSSHSIVATPASHYHFASWSSTGSITFLDQYNPSITITTGGTGTITANFELDTNSITASVTGGHGTIDPSGLVEVAHDGSQFFTVTPDTGYHVTSVLIDGVATSAPYTVSHVVDNSRTIVATFAINNYAITVTPTDYGTITGPSSVNWGTDAVYSIIPNDGYHIVDVTVDGVSKGVQTSWTIDNVKETGHSITASFAINTYTITSSVFGGIASHGAISVSQTVDYGATPTFTFTPDEGYSVSDVKVDNIAVTSTTSTTYQFPAVSATHTIEVTFSLNKQPTILTVKSNPETIPTTGGPITITATLTDDNNQPLAGKSITIVCTLSAGGTLQATQLTDSNGQIKPTFTVPNGQPYGSFYVITATFDGDSQHLSQNAVTHNETGEGGLMVVPEYIIGALAALGACFVSFAIYKKRSSLPSYRHK